MTTRLALGVTILAALCLTACGGGDTPSTSPSPAASESPAAAVTRDGWQVARWQEARAVPPSDQPLELPYRELKLTGQWRVPDCTDTTICLSRNDGKHQSVWLLRPGAGAPELVLPRALDAREGFWTSGVSVSDSWLAWEEVGPGDDLVEDVPWRLYAAPIRPGPQLGRPRLVAEGSTGDTRRPLFQLDGSLLVWTSGRRVSRYGFDSRLVVRDLADGSTRVLYRTEASTDDDSRGSRGNLHTVTLKDGVAIVMETPNLPRPFARFAIVDLTSGVRLAGIDVANEHPLSHWPAWRDGWLAWAPFGSAEAQFPELYLRSPDGTVWSVGLEALDACFIGPYLFYTDNAHEAPQNTWRIELRALRLQDMTGFVLVSGKPGLGDWWVGGGFRAPDVEHTYVAFNNRTHTEGEKEWYETLVRIYRVE